MLSLKGFKLLVDVITGVKFKDGIRVTQEQIEEEKTHIPVLTKAHEAVNALKASELNSGKRILVITIDFIGNCEIAV